LLLLKKGLITKVERIGTGTIDNPKHQSMRKQQLLKIALENLNKIFPFQM
jgi:hypothetical protein